MHFHFPFSTDEIFWTLTFAAHLVLLVVLMGRDRVKRFPWFTASITLIAFRLLATHMLFGRMPQIAMAALFIGLALLGNFLGALVLVELARRAFAGIKRPLWVGSALALMLAGAIVLATWGEWPSWQSLTGQGAVSTLQLLQLIALKASLLIDVENVLLGLVIVMFGRRAHAPFSSHTQRIAIGLGVSSLAQLGMEAAWQIIAKTAKPQTQADVQQVLSLRERLFNINSAVYIVVLIWWIWSLWRNDPAQPAAAAEPQPAPAELPS